GYQFNLTAPQQLAKLLFEDLRLPVGKRTKTGYSTDADTLEALRDKHPIVGLVLEHRQLSKLKSTYVDALPGLVDPATGRVHTSFGQASTATGRLSSSNPNLMNIPVRTELGQRIRRAFRASRPGHALFAVDYSPIALRAEARETGVVVSATGRRRATPDLRSPNYSLRQAAERMAINFPIQSLAADIIKIAMVRLQREIHDGGRLVGRMLLQVHDELV